MGGTTATLYALIDPRTDEVRYIGRTTKELKVRLAGHLAQARQPNTGGNGRARIEWIQELLAAGVSPRITPLREVPEDMSAQAETRTITEFLLAGVDLVNGDHHCRMWRQRNNPTPSSKSATGRISVSTYEMLVEQSVKEARHLTDIVGEWLDEMATIKAALAAYQAEQDDSPDEA